MVLVEVGKTIVHIYRRSNVIWYIEPQRADGGVSVDLSLPCWVGDLLRRLE